MKSDIDRDSKQPVFKQIYAILLGEMGEGRYEAEGRLPSEKELCQRFDVERNTVRKALQILVDENRVTRVPGIGTKLLSPGDMQKPDSRNGGPEKPEGNIIILITQVDYLHAANGESFHVKLIHSFEKALSKLGYNLLFKPVGQDGVVAKTIQSALPRGIIFDSFNPDSYYQEAAGFSLPCISVNHYTPLVPSIVSNNFEGAYAVAKRFADAGHQRIAFVMGKNTHQTTIERLNGVQALCGDRNIPLKNDYLFFSDWTFSSGAEAAKQILAMKPAQRPTGVFAFNDDLAYGCYSVFQAAGLSVPGDISLAGFDKSDRYTDMFPPITTVDVNLSAMVDYACWYLGSGIAGWVPPSPAKIQINTTLCDKGTIKSIL